jgi:monovalent cation:H+ antiporter-2, CPA2 family
MNIPILTDLVIIFSLSLAVLLVCHRLRIPVTIGFILTGILAGPDVLGLVKAVHEVEVLAEIGVILLLFVLGVEFSLADLLNIRRSVLLGGPLQVGVTCLAGWALASYLGQSRGEAVFIGFLISLSSTAIVLKLLQERAEVDSPHGRICLGILIFQDIIIVPMMLLVPLLSGESGNLGSSLLILLAKGVGIILMVIVSTKWIVPYILFQIAQTKNREIFLLSIVVICIAVAWLTARTGLSLALGAFLAGLIISETEYSHQALGNILPFRDIFSSFFFISIGMLLNVGFLLNHPWTILILTLGVLILKALLAGAAGLILLFPLRPAVLSGLALSQVGEFSFILSKVGVKQGLFSGTNYQLFLDVTILTMMATPLIMALAPRVAEYILRAPVPIRLKRGSYLQVSKTFPDLIDHLIIVGYGINGRNLARAARKGGIPYNVIEMNPETVKKEKKQGMPIVFGDATQEAVLLSTGIKKARIITVVINDLTATRRIVELARRLAPKVHIIVRTRYVQEVQPLHELGADEVIPEEFETAVEIFTRLLKKYLVPQEDINRLTAEVRSEGYQMFRTVSLSGLSLEELKRHVPDMDIQTFRIGLYSPAASKTLAELNLRRQYGVSLLAVRRGTEMLVNPDGEMRGRPEDLWFVMGSPDQLARVTPLFSNPKGSSPDPETSRKED